MENTYRYCELNKELQAVQVVSGLVPKESEAYRELIKIEIGILEEKRDILNGKEKMSNHNNCLYCHATALGQTVFLNTHDIADVIKEYVKEYE
ncbi:hypothetical protein [Bacillus velezensis]|uniref:hypothetical protein n=1 Tax=Bacillus velezensis TaxID=492670 RepID=UPI002FBE32BC